MKKPKHIGLTKEQILASRKKNGANVVETQKKHHFWSTLLEVVTEPLFILLVIAAVIYFLLGEYNEGFIMLAALLFVAGISLYQMNRSKNAVSALRKFAAPRATVIRNSEVAEIPAEEVVVGDLLRVVDGNLVPADGEILEAYDLSLNESIITGESLAVSKEAGNKVLKGTYVVSGSATVSVTTVGSQTELGKISGSMRQIKPEASPLQKQVRQFVRTMVIFGGIAFLLVWGINYYLTQSVIEGLLHGLTLAMSILPEEIPVALATFMALGAYRLYKYKIIARNPQTVETLGSATVICADKTGTLTQNEMKLAAVYSIEEKQLHNYSLENAAYNVVLEYAMWASEIEPFDAMEKSIHQAYSATATEDLRPHFKMVHEYPLGGKPPLMTHIFSKKSSQTKIIAAKGAVEAILAQSQLSEEGQKDVLKITQQLAKKGYRVLGVGKAAAELDNYPKSQQEIPLIFLGLIAFYDPPKENIKKTLQTFYEAGIQVKMITGDFAETALSISEQIGLRNNGKVVTGRDVMELQNDDLRKLVRSVNIFARMFPEAKLRVVQALRQDGEVVAMTGDGVNDGPALKAASIGISMGKRGSEVAKSAADLILVDDDLFRMTDAIAVGRRMYENLKKAVQYIVSIHIPIILIVIVPLLLMWDFVNIFSPIHVIFLELIMGPTCSIVYENEPIEENAMKRPPRKSTLNFLSVRELLISIVQGLVIAAACLAIGYYYYHTTGDEALSRTIVFCTLIFSNILLTLVNRSFYYSVVRTIQYRNKLVPMVLAISLILLAITLYVPSVQQIFDFATPSVRQLFLCFVISLPAVLWIEVWKIWREIISVRVQ